MTAVALEDAVILRHHAAAPTQRELPTGQVHLGLVRPRQRTMRPGAQGPPGAVRHPMPPVELGVCARMKPPGPQPPERLRPESPFAFVAAVFVQLAPGFPPMPPPVLRQRLVRLIGHLRLPGNRQSDSVHPVSTLYGGPDRMGRDGWPASWIVSYRRSDFACDVQRRAEERPVSPPSARPLRQVPRERRRARRARLAPGLRIGYGTRRSPPGWHPRHRPP
jgi:hypothetical protein